MNVNIRHSVLVVMLLDCLFCSSQTTYAPYHVNSDSTITFTYIDSTARCVKIQGNCALASEDLSFAGQTKRKRMQQTAPGVWQWTTRRALEPELYTYELIVDGRRMPDPANPDSIWVRDKRKSIIVLAGDKQTALYNPAKHQGRVEYRKFTDSLGTSFRMMVYLPYGYDTTRLYQVTYLLHGINGDHRNWCEQGRLHHIMDNLIEQGRIEPQIVVMPRCLLSEPKHEDHVESTNVWNYPQVCNGKWEKRFYELDDYVRTHYAVRDTGNAIAGLSCGARQALNIANLYPGKFRYVGLFSPDVKRKHLPDMTIDPALRPRFWVGVGIHDDMFYMSTVHYVHNLTDLQVDYELRFSRAGHHYVNWRKYVTWFMIYKNN